MLGLVHSATPYFHPIGGTTTQKRTSVPGYFTTYQRVVAVDHCCEAWNKLIERPWTIMSMGLRDWANGFDEVGSRYQSPGETSKINMLVAICARCSGAYGNSTKEAELPRFLRSGPFGPDQGSDCMHIA